MEQKTLIEDLPMLRGLQAGDEVGSFKAVLYINGRQRSDAQSALASLKRKINSEGGKKILYDLTLYLFRKENEKGTRRVESASIKEVRRIKEVKEVEDDKIEYTCETKIEKVEYWWSAVQKGKLVEELHVTLGEDYIRLEGYDEELGHFWTKLKESKDELPTLGTSGGITVLLSENFHQELLKTVTGGLTIGEFLQKVKSAGTPEEFVQEIRKGSEEAVRKMVDYLEELNSDVEWIRVAKVFGNFYDFCLNRDNESVLARDGYRVSFNPNKGIILERGNNKEVFSSWLINEDGVRYLGGKGERRIENFLIKHHEGFLKDLVEYLEKNYGKERREEQDVGIDMTM